MNKILLPVFFACILAGCHGATQYLSRPEPISAVGPYLHQPSGFSFPMTAGEFVRVDIYQYDIQGENISVSYNLDKPSSFPIAATVYIYPSPSIVSFGSPASVVEGARSRLCEQEFDAIKQEIAASYPNAKLIDMPGRPVTPTRYFALFEFEGEIAHVRQPLFSELELSCYVKDKWDVKYRITYPKGLAVAREIEDLKKTIE
jgi:hypothetical protein